VKNRRRYTRLKEVGVGRIKKVCNAKNRKYKDKIKKRCWNKFSTGV